jgi:hypothetical protein
VRQKANDLEVSFKEVFRPIFDIQMTARDDDFCYSTALTQFEHHLL